MRGRGERLPPSFFLSHFSFPFIPALFLGSYCSSAGTTTPTQCPAGSPSRSPPLPVTPQLAHRASKWKVGQEMRARERKKTTLFLPFLIFHLLFLPVLFLGSYCPKECDSHPHLCPRWFVARILLYMRAGVDTVERTD